MVGEIFYLEEEKVDIFSELKDFGVNIDEAMDRFMHNDELYKKMLLKLPSNIESQPVMSFIEKENYEQAKANAHALKGVTGNLSITPLYKAYSKAVDLFKANKPNDAKQVIREMLPIQEDIIACINKYR